MRKMLALVCVSLLVVGVLGAVAAKESNVVYDLMYELEENLDNWSFKTTIFEPQREKEGFFAGAELFRASEEYITAMLEKTGLPKEDWLVVPAIHMHPAWNGFKGWLHASVKLDLPKEDKLYLTFYLGQESAEGSDGITLEVLVNGNSQFYIFYHQQGWGERLVVDLSKWAGITVDLEFKLGWGEPPEEAVVNWDATMLGQPLIVKSL